MSKRPAAERLSAAYLELANTSKEINTDSDDLAKAITSIDDSLRPLNLGVSTWIRVSRYEDDQGGFTENKLGYDKVNGKWGIALRVVNGHDARDYDEWVQYNFNEAPRALRIEALEKLPELFDALKVEAQRFSAKIKLTTQEANEFAAAIGALSESIEK